MIAGTTQQLLDLLSAFLLSSLIGLEREYRQKSAGLRTYALIGLSAALFTLVSKHGFDDVIASGKVVLDPSRVAAQVVSGIGFIGGGVIFMRRDIVRGLTTAAAVWLTAALGMAAGAGQIELAAATTAAYFVIMFVFPLVAQNLAKTRRNATRLDISYRDGQGVLRPILVTCSRLHFTIDHVKITRNGRYAESLEAGQDNADSEGIAWPPEHGGELSDHIVTLSMQVMGSRPVSHLIAALTTIEGVRNVDTVEGHAFE